MSDVDTHMWFDLCCPRCGRLTQPLAVMGEIPNGATATLSEADATCKRCGYTLSAGDEVTLCCDVESETVERTTYRIPEPKGDSAMTEARGPMEQLIDRVKECYAPASPGLLYDKAREQDAALAAAQATIDTLRAERDALVERLDDTAQQFHHAKHITVPGVSAESYRDCLVGPCCLNRQVWTTIAQVERGNDDTSHQL